MIVSLEELKHVLGIVPESDDGSEDANLTRLILAATEWVHGQTHRYFDTPIPRTEYRAGNGNRSIYLRGHIDDSPEADLVSEGDPSTSLVVSRRTLYFGHTNEWEALVEDEDWERRGDELIFLRVWMWWPLEDEFKFEYLDGYVHAPEDIRALILELASGQYAADADSAAGTAGITSEKLGDYSYSLSSASISVAGVMGGGIVSDVSRSTLNRYKIQIV